MRSFDDWLNLPGEWVEPPNECRGGTSGVQRVWLEGRLLYRKEQVDHCYRDLRHPLGEPTVCREERALRAFAALGVRVPELVYCGTRRQHGRWQAQLITVGLEGFDSLENLCRQGITAGWSDAQRLAVFRAIGALLVKVHAARWQHGCMYPKHVFVRMAADGQFELALIDLEKCRRRLSAQRAARHDLGQLRRHWMWGDAEWQSLADGYVTAGGRMPALRR